MKVYIVETYDQILDGSYVEPTCYVNKEDAIRRVESQTYTDSDGIEHWAYWRELEVVGLNGLSSIGANCASNIAERRWSDEKH